MAVSKPKASGKKRNPSNAARKSVQAPGNPPPKASEPAAAKRTVMTSSEIEAAAKSRDAAKSANAAGEKAAAPPSKDVPQAEPAKSAGSGAVASSSSVAATEKSTPAESKSSSSTKVVSEAKEPGKAEPAKKAVEPAAPKSAALAASEKPGPVQSVAAKEAATPKAVDPKTTPKAEKVSSVTEKAKSAASAKPAAAKTTAAKKTTPSPKSAVAKAKAKPASAPKAAPKAAAKPAASPAPKVSSSPAPAANIPSNDVFGMGAMFMDPSKMEQFFDLWKAPEVDAIFTASNDAMEESVSVANDAFAKWFETMTGQADVFSGAGSRVVAQYEELVEIQQKKLEDVWQASSDLVEKSGGMSAELVAWAQREMDASQADIEALSKVESLSDFQEVNARILSRCVESSVAESEKMQNMMFAAISDSFSAMTKAANAAMK